MFPLARSLLALATAALLAAACADRLSHRLFKLGGRMRQDAVCAELSMGIIADHNPLIRVIELDRFHVDSPKPITDDFMIRVPYAPKPNEVIVGLRAVACDFHNVTRKLVLNVSHENHYTPLKVSCEGGCPEGLEVIADQFVVRALK